MNTVTHTARRFGLSRTTLLHYEKLGLLVPRRQANGYRAYNNGDLKRLEQILAYRDYGLSLSAIQGLLESPEGSHQALEQHFHRLEGEIQRLKRQQTAILAVLQGGTTTGEETPMLTKARWTAIMRAAGFSDDDMRQWHTQFERMEPQEHQAFLESLGIEKEEVAAIRRRSRP